MAMRIVLLGVLLIAFGGSFVIGPPRVGEGVDEGRGAAPFERKPPSVVLVTVGTTRADHLEPYGSDVVRTPVLQRLADEGLLVEEAYAVAPLTLPAHTSILTGRYPPETAVRNNGIHFAAPELTTLGERFGAAGYRTGAFVSASVLEARYGLDQGFEVYDDDLSRSRAHLPRMVADRPAELTVQAAGAWLDGVARDERFFLWVHLYDPHAAYDPPPRYRDAHPTHPYAGEIAYMDAQIGELLDHPRLRGARGLVVSVVGDHGESLGEHGENTHGILAYRATLHVPWILRVDGVPGGRRLEVPVSQVDVAPTLLDLTGLLERGHDMSGRSLLGPLDPERPLYSESYLPYYTYGWSPLHVLRRGGWEYIDAPSEELYHLPRDPRELSDQSGRRPDLAADLRRALAAFREEHGGDRAERELEVDAASLEKLRALGYVAMEGVPPAAEGSRADPKEMIHHHTTHERARHLIAEELYAEAAGLLEGLLEGDPRNLAALADLADARQRAGELAAAVAVIERALALAPEHPQLLQMLAQVEARRGEPERALALAERVLEQNRTNLGAWALAAHLRAGRDGAEAARETLERGLEVEPRSALLNALYAQLVEIPSGERDAAEQRLREATARDPFNPLAWRVLGRLLEEQGHLEEAEAACRAGLEHTPDDPSLHARYAVLLARRRHPDAEAHLREAIRHESGFRSELYVSLGAQLAEKGRLEEARAAYARVLEEDPDHPAARNNHAIALARSGEIEAAREMLAELVAEQPRYADAHSNLAVLLLGTGDAGGAEDHARATVELSPAAVEAWGTLGAALLAQDRPREAVRALGEALQRQPGYGLAHLHRGRARVRLDDVDGARRDLEAALAQDVVSPEAYYELARLHEGPLDDPARARAYYRAFLDRFPQDPRAKDVRARLSSVAMAP